MLVIKNREIFLETIADAIKKAFAKRGDERIENLIKQIAHAVREIETNPFLSYDRETRTLRTISRHSLTAYKNRADDVCRRAGGDLCPAAGHCYHTIMRRLYELYLEAESAAETDAVLNSEFLAMEKEAKKEIAAKCSNAKCRKPKATQSDYCEACQRWIDEDSAIYLRPRKPEKPIEKVGGIRI